MKLKEFLLIFSAWLAPLLIYVIYKLQHPSILCWDGVEEDPITGELFRIGGCEPEYDVTLMLLIRPIIIWALVLFAVLIFKYLYARQKTR